MESMALELTVARRAICVGILREKATSLGWWRCRRIRGKGPLEVAKSLGLECGAILMSWSRIDCKVSLLCVTVV